MKRIKKITLVSLVLLTIPLTTFASIDKNLSLGQKDNQVLELQEFLIN